MSVFVQVSYYSDYSEVLSEYAKKSGGLEKKKFGIDDHW